MPDDPPAPKPADKTFTQSELDQIIADRLKRESAKYADYEELKAKAAKLDAAEETAKTEAQKAADRAAAADKRIADIEKQVADAEQRALRAEVASAKGLSAAQAKRLAGTTREELEADADDLLESFPAGEAKEPVKRQPREALRGGLEPNEDPVETDPAKLAASVRRY